VLELNDLIDDLGKMLRMLIGEDIRLEVSLMPALWRVEADPGQMEQVLLNLAVNARDAMRDGGTLRIETRNVEVDGAEARKTSPPMSDGPYVVIRISDTGLGMDPETLSHIFEPFFTTKERDHGTGLGLATVYGIVKQSNGYIWADSEVGTGTTFEIYLPQCDAPQPSLATEPHRPKAPTGSETILLVEDDDGVRDMARRFLEDAGYEILEASNGEHALSIGNTMNKEIELLLADVVMPDMSGPKVAERLKDCHPETKVLFTSGYTGKAINHHGVLNSGVQFLPKPFSKLSLTNKIREVLDN
jgi:CheY-like chemotaxis protein